MEKEFKPMQSAERWQLSNAPVLSMAAARASHDIFIEAGIDKLIEKSKLLTGFLEFIINDINEGLKANNKPLLEIITPAKNRGCQLSVIAHGKGKDLHNALIAKGVISDWREPNVIRMAPVPLYNSYEDIYRFGELIKELMN